MQDTSLFVPIDGGAGTTIACTSSSGTTSRAALSTPRGGSAYSINNTGTDYAYLAFGDSSVVATTAHQGFPPGISIMGIPNAKGSGAPTRVAGITTSDSITVQITPGNMIG